MLNRLDTFSVVTAGGTWGREQELDHFIGPTGDVDFGRVLERLDISVAEVAQEQAGCGVVTIAVQGGPIRSRLSSGLSYIVNRYVTDTQGKSLEAAADILSDDGAQATHVTTLYFTFAGWDREGGHTIPVRPASPQTDLEQQLSQAARRRRTENLAYRNGSISAPTAEEAAAIARLQSQRDPQRRSVPASEAMREEGFSIDPRWRNPHGYAYGGRILQIMYDRAWNHAAQFISKYADKRMPLPLVAALNRATFDAPLRIGSQVCCTVSTVFTGETSLVERVTLMEYNAADDAPRLTNTALLTFSARDAGGDPFRLPAQVVPYGEHETRAWIEASRHKAAHAIRKAETPLLHYRTQALLYPPK